MATACEVSLLPKVLPHFGSDNVERQGHELSAGRPLPPTSEHTLLPVGTGPPSSLPGSPFGDETLVSPEHQAVGSIPRTSVEPLSPGYG